MKKFNQRSLHQKSDGGNSSWSACEKFESIESYIEEVGKTDIVLSHRIDELFRMRKPE